MHNADSAANIGMKRNLKQVGVLMYYNNNTVKQVGVLMY
jgi:hypothetical protein